MEYHEIPTAIKGLSSENSQINYAIKHDLPRYTDSNTGKIQVGVGDRTVRVDSKALEGFILKQLELNCAEIERLEGIHDTLTKVAVGLIK